MTEANLQFTRPETVDPETAVLLDCRFRLSEPDWGRAQFSLGHLPGARYADLDRDLSLIGGGAGRHPLPDGGRFRESLLKWGIGAQTPVVVYDDAAGAIAARAWWLLRAAGVARVSILDGGFQAWQAAGREVTDQATEVSPASGWATVASLPVTSQSELKTILTRPGHLLLDARSAERFAGRAEPIDRLAGHIPGACNWPFENNLDGGRLRPVAELRRDWQQLLGATPASSVVHMCGSGVTACFNLACMEHLGMTGSSLYVESWSGWICDPANPVAGL